MINKKNVLGKQPEELGVKDAIHTAIVSVRAGEAIRPGQRCGLNKDREAVPDQKGPGVADPFLKAVVLRGQHFWLLINQDEIPNVRHDWDHPTVDFSPPQNPAKQNKYLKKIADDLGVTYEQLMAACERVVNTEKLSPYYGSLTPEEIEAAQDSLDRYDLWGEWKEESLHEFENMGSGCCPEYQYPPAKLFFVDK